MPDSRYIALLRGINVGGNKKIKMADLRDMAESLGFENVKTALASGNMAWDADSSDTHALQTILEQGIEQTFGFHVNVIVLPQTHIKALVASNPFADIEVTKDTRLYVTFLAKPTPTSLDIPYHAPTGDFTILRVTDTEVCSVLTLTETRTVNAMDILEEEFGKQVTTRNWNTVLKLASL